MKINSFIILFFSILFFLLSCSPRNFVRKNEFLRNLFYPKELESGFSTGEGLGKNTHGVSFDNSDYAEILTKYVSEGGAVDYIGIKTDEDVLGRYLNSLSKANYYELSRYDKLSLLINAYNAFTLKLIIQNPGIESIKDISKDKRWENPIWNLAGKDVSLNSLEHEWIRKDFGEPKIHFALVCAAISCPKLLNEPYDGNKLIDQLNDQARHFFSVEKNFIWKPNKNELFISSILDWFRYDFAETEKGVVNYLLDYIDVEVVKDIQSSEGSLKVKYISYDWSLNGKWN